MKNYISPQLEFSRKQCVPGQNFRDLFVILFFFMLLDISKCLANENYCGTSFEDSSKCEQECPDGKDIVCPDGEACYSGVSCKITSSSATKLPTPSLDLNNNYYCGTEFKTASICSFKCPSGNDGQCPPEQQCYADVNCIDPVKPTSLPSPTTPSNLGNTQNTDNNEISGGGSSSLSILEIVGIIAGVIASVITVEESIRRFVKHRISKRRDSHKNKETDAAKIIGVQSENMLKSKAVKDHRPGNV